MPADAELRIDYNQGMKTHDAIRELRDVEAFRPTFIEQPVPGHHQAALARSPVRSTRRCWPTKACSHRRMLLVAAGRMADLVSIKIMKHGGMLAGRKVSAICEAAGIACYGGDMFETGIAHLAGTHVIAATPNISLGCEFYQAKYFPRARPAGRAVPHRERRVIVPRTRPRHGGRRGSREALRGGDVQVAPRRPFWLTSCVVAGRHLQTLSAQERGLSPTRRTTDPARGT